MSDQNAGDDDDGKHQATEHDHINQSKRASMPVINRRDGRSDPPALAGHNLEICALHKLPESNLRAIYSESQF